MVKKNTLLDKSLVFIVNYFNEPDDLQNQAQVKEFRAASSANNNYFLEIEKLWNLSAAAGPLQNIDQKKSVKQFTALLNRNSLNKSYKSLWYVTAAAIFIVALGYLIFKEQTKTQFVVVQTAQNQIDTVKLADGSLVILAENSEFKYPSQFKQTAREVYFKKGQAFFKIAKNPNCPFKVVMQKSNVTVLGTSFNIKVSASEVSLGVKTGSVFFSPHLSKVKTILHAGQGLTYSIEKNEIAEKAAQNADAWLTKELIFVDTPLEQVCKELSAYYNTPILLNNKKTLVKKLNANFKDKQLDQVLEVLSKIYNLTIKKDHNNVYLTANINH